jgi:hypothetical protein
MEEGKKSTIVVVTRPYWLSFYSKWALSLGSAPAIKEADCR